MEAYLSLFAKSVFVENILLAYFLGMCSFLAVSKRVSTAVGLGGAVIFVLVIATPTNWFINNYWVFNWFNNWFINNNIWFIIDYFIC